MVKDFLRALLAAEFKEMLVHHETISGTERSLNEPVPPLNPQLEAAMRKYGIGKLYTHQAQAIELVRAGENPVSITPTASGKTLSYNIPILEYFLQHDEGHALYLFPLKALEQDQLKKLVELNRLLPESKKLRAAIYDGDTPPSARAKIRANFPRFLITNPEMLHLAVSQYHKGWDKFLRNLKFVVVDELHTYKGIFGSHMSQLFRRLNRICEHYGSSPQYIASSATIANPVELAERLTGKPFRLIEESGAPTAKRHYIFMNPELSVYTVASKLFRLGLELGLKTIVFTKARKITELIYQWVLEAAPELEGSISAYRAGFLPEERREIETMLESGKMRGVISTSALEMGIDIGHLDLCILVGYPGTISATFQRGGRVGRKSESVVVMLAQANALDQYFMNNPQDFFGRSYESAVIDTENPFILKKHIECAAVEIPISKEDKYYGPERYESLLKELVKKRKLQLSAEGDRWYAVKSTPHREVDLRASGEIYTITDVKGRIIGSVSGSNVFSECHPGAIYLHRGKQYLVSEMDIEHKNISVKLTDVPYYTNATSKKDTKIISAKTERQFENFILNFGDLKVTEWITGYDKKRIHTQERLGSLPLDIPEQSYETVGLWMQIPRRFNDWCDSRGLNFMGGLHGIEHILLALVPLYALADRGDMGGISLVEHTGAGGPAIFLYDGYPGGVGFAKRIFEVFEQLAAKALKVVSTCKCEAGCPSCIYSPRCGSGNHPLDKEAVIGLLEMFTAGEGFPALKRTIAADGAERVATKPRSIEITDDMRPPALISDLDKIQGKILVFDLETQYSAEEVGGWKNIEKMRLAVGVTLDIKAGRYGIFYEDDAERLIRELEDAGLVIGFNLKRFDYRVLKAYGLENEQKIKTLDLLQEIERELGHRLSLNSLAEATLEAEKSADGLQSIEWFKEGKLDLVTQYCQKDVELTRDLFLYGRDKGHLLYRAKKLGKVRVRASWGK